MTQVLNRLPHPAQSSTPAFASFSTLASADLHARSDEAIVIARHLAERLATTAAERDQIGGHAAKEREWIRESGLLTLSIPKEFGGQGADWSTVYQVIRILAKADSALAHIFGFHHLQLAGIQLYGNAQQQRRLLTASAEQEFFWGNALNPLDKRTIASPAKGGYILNGVKSFSSGSVGSDWLTISAWDETTQSALVAAIPTNQPGITVQADWDAFGQKQTDSGNVHFAHVFLPDEWVLQRPAQTPTPQATLRSQIAQLVMVNLYLGIGLGAFDAARNYTNDQAKAWFASGVNASAEDPFIQHRYGQLWMLLRPAIALADQAATTLDQVFDKGVLVTANDRGELAIAIAEAKYLAHQAGIEVSSQMFELTGARSTSSRYGYDRFWRNARVHTLHDPIDYKLRDLGRYVLDGRLPEPTPYS
ncbi:acyl-CoA dehydrogenase family protein [Undibacterium sp. RuTC16W]|uniref:acyl-CoA dehydrogenase family protein n=1 Tax=Undibacterium sp. RuTC16W TaxID=3413048 RepID=UPI003BF386A3